MCCIYAIKTTGEQTFCEIWRLMCSSALSCGILLLLSDHDIGVRVVGCDDAVRITQPGEGITPEDFSGRVSQVKELSLCMRDDRFFQSHLGW
jgi:hypothetical protein